MKVFLAVDVNGVKLATRATFWHAATDEMMALPTVEIWAFLRENGWVYKEIKLAMKARRRIIKSNVEKKDKRRDYEAAIANIDMSVFLVEENGVKLATKRKFWHAVTSEIMSLDTAIIREFLQDNGWLRKDINTAMSQRWQTTSEGKAKYADLRTTPEYKEYQEGYRKEHREEHLAQMAVYYVENREDIQAKKKTPEAKEARREWARQRYATDPLYRLMILLRGAVKTTWGLLVEEDLTNEQIILYDQRTLEIVGCTLEEFKQHIYLKFKEGTGFESMGKYSPQTHSIKPTYELDHNFPMSIAVLNKDNIPGLLEFINNYRNLSPLDAAFNQLKFDHIILELIHPDCPALSRINNLNGVNRVFQTVDEFLAYKSRSHSEFPLL